MKTNSAKTRPTGGRFAALIQATVVCTLLGATVGSGCSIRRMAVNKIGDALASGGATYDSDEDIELVGQALPFGLKLIESLLEESPRHRGLLLTACRGFTTYSYAYVEHDIDAVAERDLAAAARIRARARKLYLRARRYGLRGLEAAYPGITERLQRDPAAALVTTKEKHVPLLYWNAAALGLAISVSRDDAEMLARLPEVEALLGRALQLDEDWNEGALHEFEVTLASARPGTPDYERIDRHFERALALSGGKRAGLYVAYAEAASYQRQNRAEFKSKIEQALALDPDQHEELRLANLVAQRRARWLLAHVDDLILDLRAEDRKADDSKGNKQ